jgi:metallo-beta-lactamase class B
MIQNKRAVALFLLAAMAMLLRPDGRAQAQTPEQLVPFPPFKLADNIYYVGLKAMADYLIATPEGLILINTDWDKNVPLLRASVEKLGFKFSDIKIILLSHAHPDHSGGSAAIKAQTGARYMVMEQDVVVIESGGKEDFRNNDPPDYYSPVKVDRVLRDGDKVSLGGTELTAHLTPGHTRGCTTWTMKVQDGGKSYNAVFVCSAATGPKVDLLHNPKYPLQADDYERTFIALKSLPVDIFLTPHGSDYNLEEKYAQLQRNGATNPFVDPAGYAEYVAKAERDFRSALARQRAAQQSSVDQPVK